MRRLIFILVLAGCGNVPNKNSMDMGAGGGDMTGAGPSGDLATGPSCTTGKPCQTGSGNGLCGSGTCNTCTDTTDDATCATVYGAGNICLGGACALGCRTPADCGGNPCTNNMCAGAVSCTSDADCGDPTLVCNTGTMMCVAATGSCGAVTAAACPINAADFCCTPSTTCTPGNCCGTGACTVVAANDGTCTPVNGGPVGNCVLNSCGSPPATTRYVDFSAAAGGSGSMACPFSTLTAALSSLGAGGGTLLVKGGATGITSGAASHQVGNIKFVGTDASFAACTPATCSDATKWPTLTIGNFYLFKFTAGTKSTNALEYMTLTGPGSTTSTNAAIIVTGAGVDATIDHVAVSGFQQGLLLSAGGTAHVGSTSSFNNNHTGANLQSGTGGGGNLVVSVTTGDGNVTFSSNNLYGIYSEGGSSAATSATVTITAPAWSTTSSPQVRASSNGSSGVRISSLTSSSITGLVADSNGGGGDATITYYDGMTIFAGSTIKVRNCHFGSNSDTSGTKGNGIHIVPNGKDVPGELANINLGKAADYGLNTFNANQGAGLCLDQGPAEIGPSNNTPLLPAQGNLFDGGAKDCSKTAAKLSSAATCTGAVNVSSDNFLSENISMCTF